jgi:DNA-binding CsgD family transcriptional regulator
VPHLTAVLVRVARGMSNAEIGRDLFVSEHSVKSRMQAIFDELGVRDRAAAVRAGLECGAISLVPRGRLRAFPGATSDRAGVAGPVEALAASQTQSGTAGMRQAATGALRALPAASAPDAQVPR